MSGWAILSASVICGTGVLLFLKLVADQIELATESLQLFEKREQTARRKRIEAAEQAAQAAAEVVAEVVS